MLDVGPMVTENLPASSIDTHTDNDIGTDNGRQTLSRLETLGVSECRRLGGSEKDHF